MVVGHLQNTAGNPCESSLRGNGVYMYNIIIMGNG
jgi:hypothetical protein